MHIIVVSILGNGYIPFFCRHFLFHSCDCAFVYIPCGSFHLAFIFAIHFVFVHLRVRMSVCVCVPKRSESFYCYLRLSNDKSMSMYPRPVQFLSPNSGTTVLRSRFVQHTYTRISEFVEIIYTVVFGEKRSKEKLPILTNCKVYGLTINF